MCFMVFQNEKVTFQAIKTTSSKSRKSDIFLRGVSTWFWSKIEHFFRLFLLNIRHENVFYDFTISQNEKTTLYAIKTRSWKSRKIDIFSKGLVSPWFCPELAIFPPFFYNIKKENVFYGFLERKSNFLGYKNNKFKKSKK